MANEIRGVLYETITYIAVQRACTLANIPGTVFQNEKPRGMDIEPDITVGITVDAPSHLFLITASGSSKESEKKSWRNLAEVFQARAQLQSQPIIVNLYYLSNLKEGVGKVTDQLYDTVLHVDRQPYFGYLESWVKANLSSTIRTIQDRRTLLENDAKRLPDLNIALNSLAQDLANAMRTRNTALDSLWLPMRADYEKMKTSPTPRKTSLRRGLAKLLVPEPHLRQAIYDNFGKTTPIRDVPFPDYAYRLGFVANHIGGVRVEDEEIKAVLKLLGPQECERVLQFAPPSVDVWVQPLRNLDNIAIYVDFVAKHYDEVTDPEGLRALLVRCYADPAGLSGIPTDTKVWLFEILMSLIKAQSGKLQGYGFAQLSLDTGIAEHGAGAALLRFAVPRFVQRVELPDKNYMAQLATGLANRFKTSVMQADMMTLRTTVSQWVIKENLEDRLISYRNFEPLLWLLQDQLQQQGFGFVTKTTCGGWITEYTNADRMIASTPFVIVNGTYIHWKTATDQGRDHKTKELCARARNLRYQWRPESQTFTRRQGVEQLVLILDGDWTERNLKSLTEAGWDQLIYPDEISAFVASLPR